MLFMNTEKKACPMRPKCLLINFLSDAVDSPSEEEMQFNTGWFLSNFFNKEENYITDGNLKYAKCHNKLSQFLFHSC